MFIATAKISKDLFGRMASNLNFGGVIKRHFPMAHEFKTKTSASGTHSCQIGFTCAKGPVAKTQVEIAFKAFIAGLDTKV